MAAWAIEWPMTVREGEGIRNPLDGIIHVFREIVPFMVEIVLVFQGLKGFNSHLYLFFLKSSDPIVPRQIEVHRDIHWSTMHPMLKWGWLSGPFGVVVANEGL